MGLNFATYRGRKVLVTGHTGFKGGWVTQWLLLQGAEVFGLALKPTGSPNLFSAARLAERIADEECDLRDLNATRAAFSRMAPEIVFHLAAQSLVRKSYRNPLETFSTNVMGTAHVLDAAFATPSVKAVVVVTSDKCYAPSDSPWGFREHDALGGNDPYSASKACAELLAQSWTRSFGMQAGAPLVATVRAGNVIGGGDWAEDRLIPDLARASGKNVAIRNPTAIRPWQHVLEPLAGYLLVGEKLLDGQPEYAKAWNFGPGLDSMRPVSDLCRSLAPALDFSWHADAGQHPPETHSLRLDSTLAQVELGWRPRLGFEQTLKLTGDWYARFTSGEPAAKLCEEQIEFYRGLQ